MGPGPDNPAGYWENRAVKELDDELLAHLGGAWDQPPLLEPGWELDPGLDPFRDRAPEILDRDLPRPPAGPAPGVQGAAAVACSTRSGGRSCRSATRWSSCATPSRWWRRSRRNGMDPGQGAVLWLRYLLAVTTDARRCCLRLDDLTDRPTRPRPGSPRTSGCPSPRASASTRCGRRTTRPCCTGARQRCPDDPAPSSPNLDLAMAVWNDGEIDLAALPDALRAAVARGLARPARATGPRSTPRGPRASSCGRSSGSGTAGARRRRPPTPMRRSRRCPSSTPRTPSRDHRRPHDR